MPLDLLYPLANNIASQMMISNPPPSIPARVLELRTSESRIGIKSYYKTAAEIKDIELRMARDSREVEKRNMIKRRRSKKKKKNRKRRIFQRKQEKEVA